MYQYTILSKCPHRQQIIRRNRNTKLLCCAACEGGTLKAASRPYVEAHQNCTIVIENVPVMVCGNCGEVYYFRDTMEKLENIVKYLKQPTGHLAVVDFADATSLALMKLPV